MNRELGMEVWYFSLRGATRRCLVVEGARWAHSQAKFEDLQCPSLGTLANTPNQLIIIIKIELPFKVSLIMCAIVLGNEDWNLGLKSNIASCLIGQTTVWRYFKKTDSVASNTIKLLNLVLWKLLIQSSNDLKYLTCTTEP